MHQFLADLASQSQQHPAPASTTTSTTHATTYLGLHQGQQQTASGSASAPGPASHSQTSPPTDDVIEAVIQQATSARATPDGRPLRDTRTQLFIGNVRPSRPYPSHPSQHPLTVSSSEPPSSSPTVYGGKT